MKCVRTNLHRTIKLENEEEPKMNSIIKMTEAKQQGIENAEQKKLRSKLRHEYNKRRKEGEEKAHEDGGMVGCSRHLEDGDSKMSVQAAT